MLGVSLGFLQEQHSSLAPNLHFADRPPRLRVQQVPLSNSSWEFLAAPLLSSFWMLGPWQVWMSTFSSVPRVTLGKAKAS